MKLLPSTVRLILFASCASALLEGVPAQTTTRVSVTSAGYQLNAKSFAQDLTPDGRHVVILSTAPGGPSGDAQVVVHDRVQGTRTFASVNVNGKPGNGPCTSASISDDGRLVAFASEADDLVGGDTNSAVDVFVRDLWTGVTTLASTDPAGVPMVGGGHAPDISGDGRFVAFQSLYYAWVGGAQMSDFFVHDLLTAVTEKVSLTNGGQPLYYSGACQNYHGCPASYTPAISYDGRFVAFATMATNLAPGGNPYFADVFVRDRLLGTTTPVAVTAGGLLAGSDQPSISADGRYVAFHSQSPLVAGDTNGTYDVYVLDRSTGVHTLASIGPGGVPSNGYSDQPSLSHDGAVVVFSSFANNLTAPDNNGASDVFQHDLATGVTSRVSLTYGGGQTSGMSDSARTSGHLTVFTSQAQNLVLDDTNGQGDAFLRDTGPGVVPVLRYCAPKLSSKGCLPRISVAGLPSASGQSLFLVLATKTPTNRRGFFFWGLGSKIVPFSGGSLCVQGPLQRTPVVPPGGLGGTMCTGKFSFPFDAAYMGAHGISAGVSVYGQYYVYDRPPELVGLTDAIQFTVAP